MCASYSQSSFHIKRPIEGVFLPPSQFARTIAKLITEHCDSTILRSEFRIPVRVAKDPMCDVFSSSPGAHLLKSVARETLTDCVVCMERVAGIFKS